MVESIFVNDSSIDDSLDVLRSLQAEHEWIQVITLAKNYGQHSATVAGILYSCGDWVFTIDEDLQHEPKFFYPLLQHAVIHALDVVYAKPQESVHQSVWRDLSSTLYKKFLSTITANPHIPSFNSFRLIRGAVARSAASVCSHETYFDIALCWFTDRVGTKIVPMKDLRYIHTKKSGYTLHKLLSHARRMIVTSPVKVLRTGALIGMLANALSVILGGVIFAMKLINPDSILVPGWTSTFLSVLFFGGLISFLLGVNLEYVTTILLHSQGKPPFFVIDRSLDDAAREYFERGT